MANQDRDLLRLRVELENIEPPIWRELLVPARFSFWDLHVAIQDSMGWWDTHLHDFRITDTFGGEDRRFGIPDEEWGFGDQAQVDAGWEHRVIDHLDTPGDTTLYSYDYGDGWEHRVTLLSIEARSKGQRYPQCVAGERACPPEDCGGPYRYADLLEAIADPSHPEHEELRSWVPQAFDPERFDPKAVRFSQPTRRLRQLLDVDD
ncbi:MAG: plasmid pRiA4b ORF-3 family protein [Gammaproteobacteria bacterium]|nr:plasmid pRiA4b ORF-3 family protein [Gammaproteobacteria bacterium]